MKWERVAISDKWGAGADHSLGTPLGKLPEFWLRPRHIWSPDGKKRHLVNYTVDFASGFLADGWVGAVFTPMGKEPVKIDSLPDWSESQRGAYQNTINKADGSLCDSRTERLESIIPYVSKDGKLGYNVVKIFYLPHVRKSPTEHVYIIRIQTHKLADGSVQGQQDGTAHGPPD